MGKDKEILVRNILFQGNCACAQGYTVWGTSEATHCRENRLYCNDPDKSLSKHTNTIIYPGCGIVSIIATMHYLKYSIFNKKKKLMRCKNPGNCDHKQEKNSGNRNCLWGPHVR